MTLFTNLVFKMVAFSLLFKIPAPKRKKERKKKLFNSTQYKGTSTIKSRNKLSQCNTFQVTAPGDQKSILQTKPHFLLPIFFSFPPSFSYLI
jgi:hypothetical protein